MKTQLPSYITQSYIRPLLSRFIGETGSSQKQIKHLFRPVKVLTILSYRMQSSANTSPSKNQNTGISQVNNSPNTQNSYLPSLIDIGQQSQLNSRISNYPSEVSRSSRITSQHSSVINRANERNNEQTERAKAFYRNWVRRDVNQGHGMLFQGGNQLNFPIEMVMRINPPSQPREGA